MKKIFQKGKRFLALTLAAALSLSGLPAVGGMEAKASTELTVENYDQNGGGTVSAYTFAGARFDVEGITNPALIGTDNPYNGSGVQATFARAGYGTYYKVGGDITTGGAKSLNSGSNGGVMPAANPISSNPVDNLEFKVKVYPSKDEKVIIVEYTVYNATAAPINNVKFASDADVMISTDDYAAIVRNRNSTTMRNQRAGDTLHNGDTFELLTKAPAYGIDNKYKEGTFAEAGGEFRTWMGIYYNRNSHEYEHYAPDSFSGSDSGLSYSWEIPTLGPYQKVVRKVGFATRGTSIYVNYASGNDSNDGAATTPVKTLQKAFDKIAATMGYVFIQNYPEIGSAADAVIPDIPAGKTIVIQSADYDISNNPTSAIVTLKRAAGYTNPLINIPSNGSVRLSNITLDGNKAAATGNDSPLIEAGSSGKVFLQKGATLQNNKVTSDNKGSAVNLNGSAELEMNYGEITGNESKKGGAVYHNGGKLAVKNSALIRGNVNDASKELNLVLKDATKNVEVIGPLVDDEGNQADIKVTVNGAPAPSNSSITAADQETVVAKPSAAYAGSVSDTPAFLSNFTFDEETAMNNRGWTLTSGTTTVGHAKMVIAKRTGRRITFNVVEAPDDTPIEAQLWDAGPLHTALTIPAAIALEKNDVVDSRNIVPPALPADSKYTYYDTQIDMNGGTGLTVGTQGEGYKLKGSMPDSEVTVTYRFKRNDMTLKFDVNGGTPAVLDKVGPQLSDLQDRSVPSVSKYGYNFKYWDPTPGSSPSGDEIPVTGQLPQKFPIGKITGPAADRDVITYKAMWEVNTDLKSKLNVTYKNVAGTIELAEPKEDYLPVEAPISETPVTIPGYVVDVASSNAVPTITGNTFNPFGVFTGQMPSQDLDVNIRYTPDTSPAGKSRVTVKHIKNSDNSVIQTDTQDLAPEDNITGVAPLTGAVVAGLTVLGGTVTAGKVTDPLTHKYGMVGESFDRPDPDNGIVGTWAFTGVMPNQDVTIEYRYGITGTGQTLNVHYIDNDAIDPNLKKITDIQDKQGNDITNNPNQFPVAAGDAIQDQDGMTTYIPIYGYNLSSTSKDPASVTPDFDPITHEFNGTMPPQDIDIKYTYTRDASKWVRVTFKTVDGATLGRSTGLTARPADLVSSGSDFYVDVLKGGDARSYTWEKIKDKNLVPEVTVTDNNYYTHDGWFIDSNDNGIKEDNENLLTDDATFNGAGPIVVRPNIVKTPGAWFDIKFEVGDHITQNSGVNILNTRATETLAGAIAAAGITYTIEQNYLDDGWYMFGNVTTLADNVQNGATYRIEAKPDPAVFGLAPSAKQAEGSLLPNGRGRVTVYDTKPGYKYVLTDKDGNVVNVKPGNALETTVVFDNLQAGTQYKVYEVSESVIITPGASINSVPAGDKSDPTKVTVPVLDNNYAVTPDPNNDGKTKITINPADPTLEYALVDDAGNLVTISPEAPNGWQATRGSNPATVSFSNLPLGKNFTVITRPAGSNASVADRIDGGSKFNSDPGSELEVPTYILETRKAGMAIQSITRDGNNILSAPTDIYEELHEGDRVSLLAPATDAQGNTFKEWKVTIGAAQEIIGIAAQQRNIDITVRKANLVISAVYNVQPTVPSLANVQDEVRGGSSKQIALDPEGIEALQNNLTTTEDRVLMDTNHVDVTYKVIYKKSAATATASDAIQAIYTPAAPEAFTAAWQIGVNVERYVNGRKVELPSGHPSNYPGTLTSYVQLDDKDIDMLDYKLYEIDDTTGNVVGEVAMSRNPAEGNGISGLFTFQARVGHSYVLVYNKAFKLSFVNNHVDFYPTASQNPAHKLHTVKVRRGSDSNDAFTDWMNESPILSPYERLGITYTKRGNGWSYTDTLAVGKAGYRAYDPTAAIQKKTVVYAAYDDDSEQVQQAAGDLDSLINRLVNLGNDNFLKRGEFSDMKAGIATLKNIAARPGMLAILNSTNPADAALKADFERYATMTDAQLDEIAATLPPAIADKLIKRRPNLREIDAIKRYESFTVTDPVTKQRVKRVPALAERFFQQQLNPRYEGYAGTVSSRSSGGSSGSGGGTGRGTADKPFIPTPPKTYSVGGNGNWVQHADGRWSFVLTGGIRLTSKWAKLEYSTGDRSADGWYHFNSYGLMDTGWFLDEKGNWYYCNTEKDGFQGKMKTGWLYNDTDKNWYYLDPDTGMMRTGWVEVAGKWYYFAPQTSAQTYAYDAKAEHWNYLDNGVKPMGSMYANTTTPDGYRVGADGALVN